MLPNTERITAKVLCLPNGTAVNSETVNKICSIIRYTIMHGAEILEDCLLDQLTK